MLDILVAHLILQERKIAYVVTDEQLCIHQVGGKHDLLEVNGNVVAFGASLFELAPELIGSEEQLQALFNGTLSSFQLELVNRETRGGTLYYVTLHNYAYAADHGRVTGILHIVEDVTFIGETHQRLTQQRNELFLLHDQLNRAALKLEAANAELRALDELKSKFVSIAAHELRTPLATILGYVDLMRNNPLERIPPDHQKGINIIDKSARRLLVITNNLLDVTRIEADRLELTLESLDLAAVIEEVALHLKPEIDQKQHRFTIKTQPDLPRVLCDESRTIQIFSNLLGNAIKYTPEQGTIAITLHHSTKEAVVIVAIADNGIGIPAKDLQNIGKSFFRASNAHLAGVNGAGLGLSITRSLVELQGGQLWIESKLGEGSTFYLTVPIDDGLLHYNQYRR